MQPGWGGRLPKCRNVRPMATESGSVPSSHSTCTHAQHVCLDAQRGSVCARAYEGCWCMYSPASTVSWLCLGVSPHTCRASQATTTAIRDCGKSCATTRHTEAEVDTRDATPTCVCSCDTVISRHCPCCTATSCQHSDGLWCPSLVIQRPGLWNWWVLFFNLANFLRLDSRCCCHASLSRCCGYANFGGPLFHQIICYVCLINLVLLCNPGW